MLRISYNLNIRGFGIRGFGIRGFGIRGFGKGKSFCMRKFIVSVVVALVVLCGASFYVYKSDKVSETYENKEIKNDNNMLSMMLETEFNSGEYQETTASAWPTEGYVFNTTLSKCKNGSVLSWDNDEKQVKFDGNTKDECYVYFDVYKEPTIITDICKSNDNLSNCIKNLYVSQGKNNLYLHDSSLTNGAGDNSYRYAGSSDTTNNFVCFGYDSNDGSCPTDNLYRIIGVFDNQVKLIKYDYATKDLLGEDGNYYKHAQNAYAWGNWSTTWGDSGLNTVNLNTNFINNIGRTWSDKIIEHKWITGGMDIYTRKAEIQTTFKSEIVSPASGSTYTAKIGLMYVSDYGYAAAPSAWTTYLYKYDSTSITDVNWMFKGNLEWTITEYSKKLTTTEVYFLYGDGGVEETKISDYHYSVRPTFYLNSDVTYISGDGTMSSPILLS